jgi:hypothetical protein
VSAVVVVCNIYFFINSGLMHLERDNRTILWVPLSRPSPALSSLSPSVSVLSGFTLLPADEFPAEEETTRESLVRMRGELEESQVRAKHTNA